MPESFLGNFMQKGGNFSRLINQIDFKVPLTLTAYSVNNTPQPLAETGSLGNMPPDFTVGTSRQR